MNLITFQILKTIPGDEVKIGIIGIEINHVPEGRKAVKKFMEQKGFIFIKLQKIDYFFYNPNIISGEELGSIE